MTKMSNKEKNEKHKREVEQLKSFEEKQRIRLEKKRQKKREKTKKKIARARVREQKAEYKRFQKDLEKANQIKDYNRFRVTNYDMTQRDRKKAKKAYDKKRHEIRLKEVERKNKPIQSAKTKSVQASLGTIPIVGTVLAWGAGHFLNFIHKIKNNQEAKKANKDQDKDNNRRNFGILSWVYKLGAIGIFLFGLSGIMLTLTAVVSSGIVGILLSHPEAIVELWENNVLGDATFMGNVNDDVTVEIDGEKVLLVAGDSQAAPGCFVYNDVEYCGEGYEGFRDECTVTVSSSTSGGDVSKYIKAQFIGNEEKPGQGVGLPLSDDYPSVKEFDITTKNPSHINAEYLNTFLDHPTFKGSVIKGKGKVILEESEKHKISVALFFAQVLSETSMGKKPCFGNPYNIGCVKGYKGTNAEGAIRAWFKLLRENYADKGFIKWKDYIERYAPSIENDHASLESEFYGTLAALGYFGGAQVDSTDLPDHCKTTSGRNASGKLKGKDLEEQFYHYFSELGMSDAAIAGMAGNIYQESGFAINSIQTIPKVQLENKTPEEMDKLSNTKPYFGTNGYQGRGLIQWSYSWKDYNVGSATHPERWNRLMKWARKRNMTEWSAEAQFGYLAREIGLVDDPEVPLEYGAHLINNGIFYYGKGIKGLKNWYKTNDLVLSVYTFERFERASPTYVAFDNRINAAKDYYAKIAKWK